MTTKKLITIICIAGLSAVIATLISKVFGVESSAAIGGGVGGAVAGVIVSRQSSKKI